MKAHLYSMTVRLGTGLAGLVVSFTVLAAPPVPEPNILLVIADDPNDWIDPMRGHPQVKTPTLDKLASLAG